MSPDEQTAAIAAMSGASLKAAAGLGQLSSAQIAAAQSALAMANAQIALARAESMASKESAQKALRSLQLSEAMKAAKAVEADAAKKASQQAKDAADAAAAASAKQAEAVEAVKHPIDAAVGALAKMGPQGQAAAAALTVMAAAAAVTVGTLASLAEKAIEVGERMALLRAGFAGLAGSAAGGRAVQDMISGLGLPIATSEVNNWAASLVGAGVKGKQLEAELRAIASAEALKKAFGGGGGAAAENFFKVMGNGGKEADEMLKKIQAGGRRGAEAIKAMGLNVEDFGGQAALAKMNAEQLVATATKALQMKGAPALEAMANSWDVIKMKATEGFASIFSGLGGAKGPVESFMGAVKSLFGEFSKGGVAVNLLRPIVTTVFSTLFAWGTKALNAIHRGFLMAAIAGLQLYIYLRPALTQFKEFLTSANMLRGVAIIFGLLALPFVALAAVMLVVVGVIGAVIAAVGLLVAAFVYVVGAVAGFVASIVGAFADAYAAATGAGGSFVDGLIAGITAGAGKLVAAVTGLASSALGAFKSAFGIASPSKVMLEHGEKNIAGGLSAGVDRGADKVDASMASLGAGGAGTPAGGGAKGGGVHIHGPISIIIDGAQEPSSIRDEIMAFLQSLRDEGPEPVPS